MQVILAPNKLDFSNRSVFLAGSIGLARWQDDLTKQLEDLDVTVLNPRRDDWDASWVQSKDDPKFKEQVTWELNALSRADVIVMYFDPATQAPISLLEFGMYAQSGKLVVLCPDGFWKKGNVDMVCERHDVSVAEDMQSLINVTRAILDILSGLGTVTQ